MGKRRDRNTPHAEGMHGPKTHEHLIDQLESGPPRSAAGDEEGQDQRRLVQDREQHDEAEKNSERTRLHVESDRGDSEGARKNAGALHGVRGSREHRANFKALGPDGLPVEKKE